MITKIELINKLQSPEQRIVLRAVEDLRCTGMLSDGSLRGIALCQAVLEEADLRGADLCYVDLHQANMDSADLTNAKLQASKLNRASLRGANLKGANLTNADLYKVNLRGALYLTEDQLGTVNELFGSIMPDGSVYNGRFNLFGDIARAKWAKVNTEDPKAMAEFYGVSLDTYMQGQKKEVAVLATPENA
jgi:uncharacterized protein YjbI with pentapeptide repeats